MDEWKSYIDEAVDLRYGDLVIYKSSAATIGVTRDRSMYIGIIVDVKPHASLKKFYVLWHRLTDRLIPRIVFDANDLDSAWTIPHTADELLLLASRHNLECLTGISL